MRLLSDMKNSNNHELLFDHLSKSVETITLQSPRSEIIVLGDFNVHNSDWFSYSSNVTNPAGWAAEVYAIVDDLTQVVSEPTCVHDRAGDKANALDIFLISNPNICSPPTVGFPLGNSGHCLITLRYDFLPHLDRPLALQRVFRYNKADWDSLRTFYSSYPWSSGFSNDPSSFASSITDAIRNTQYAIRNSLVIKIPLNGSMHSAPKLRITKTSTSRNGSDFKPNIQELLSSTHATLAPKPSKMPNHFVSNASTTKSLPAMLALAPFSLWPKLSPKTFANHLALQ